MNKRWRYSRAILWGLGLSIVAFVINGFADGWKEADMWLSNGRPGEIIGYFGGRLLSGPLIFIVVAFILNLFVKEPTPTA